MIFPGLPSRALNRLQRCYERRGRVIKAFFDLTDVVITVRGLIRKAWAAHHWEDRTPR